MPRIANSAEQLETAKHIIKIIGVIFIALVIALAVGLVRYQQSKNLLALYQASPGCTAASPASASSLPPCADETMIVIGKEDQPGQKNQPDRYYLTLQTAAKQTQRLELFDTPQSFDAIPIGSPVIAQIWRNKIRLISMQNDRLATYDHPEALRRAALRPIFATIMPIPLLLLLYISSILRMRRLSSL